MTLAVKRISIYVAGVKDIGQWYPRDDDFNLIGYSNVDYASHKANRKSTSGTANFLNNKALWLYQLVK